METSSELKSSVAGNAAETNFFLVFILDDRRYAIAMEGVERVVRAFAPAPLPKGHASVSGLLNIHGRVMPLLDLRHIFVLPERELISRDYFIIAAGPAGACAIAADSVPVLAGFHADELIPADPEFRGEYVTRVIKSPDGLILIFDPRRLLRREEINISGTPGGEQ
jgi:purine-binding chemotaxis protein CheW